MKKFSFLILVIGFLFSSNIAFAQSSGSCDINGTSYNVQAGNGEVTITGGTIIKLISISPDWQNWVTVCDNNDSNFPDCSSSGVISVPSGDYAGLHNGAAVKVGRV